MKRLLLAMVLLLGSVPDALSQSYDLSNSTVVPTGGAATALSIISAKANAALPSTGGTMTGPLMLSADPTATLGAATKNYVDTRVGSAATVTPVTTITSSGTAQTVTFPTSGNTAYDVTLSANCTITLNGGTVGQYQTITLILRQNATAGWVPTLPSGVRWSGGIAPIPNTQAGKIDVFTLSTPDGGTTVFGSY